MSVERDTIQKQIEKTLHYLNMEKGRKRNQGILRRRKRLREAVSLLYNMADALDSDQIETIFTEDIIYGIDRLWRLLNLKHPKLETPFHISEEQGEFFRRQLEIARREAAFEEFYPTMYYVEGEKHQKLEKEHGVMFTGFKLEELQTVLYCIKNIGPIFKHLESLVDELCAMKDHMEHVVEDIFGENLESLKIDKDLLERTIQRIHKILNELENIIKRSKKLEMSPPFDKVWDKNKTRRTHMKAQEPSEK